MDQWIKMGERIIRGSNVEKAFEHETNFMESCKTHRSVAVHFDRLYFEMRVTCPDGRFECVLRDLG